MFPAEVKKPTAEKWKGVTTSLWTHTWEGWETKERKAKRHNRDPEDKQKKRTISAAASLTRSVNKPNWARRAKQWPRAAWNNTKQSVSVWKKNENLRHRFAGSTLIACKRAAVVTAACCYIPLWDSLTVMENMKNDWPYHDLHKKRTAKEILELALPGRVWQWYLFQMGGSAKVQHKSAFGSADFVTEWRCNMLLWTMSDISTGSNQRATLLFTVWSWDLRLWVWLWQWSSTVT